MKLFLFLLVSVITLPLKSQDVVFESNFDEADVRDAFTLLGISNFKYKIPAEFKGYYFDLVIKEYYEGKQVGIISQSKHFEAMRKVLQWNPETPEYTLKIQSAKLNDSIETYNVRMPGIGLRGKPLKLKFPRQQYGWATLIDDKTGLVTDTELPILAFATNPSNAARPGVAVYCELAKDKGIYNEWYTKYKVQHCFIFCLVVTKT